MGSESFSQRIAGDIGRNGGGPRPQNWGGSILSTGDERISKGTADSSKDAIFEVLKNSRRRQIIRYLVDAGRTVTTAELAEHIAAIENDVDVTQLDSKQRKRVYVALYQTHLPKLDKEDIVEYDDDRGRVELSENAAAVRQYLDYESAGYETVLRYFATCLVGGALVLLLALIGRKTTPLRLGVLIAFSLAISVIVSIHGRPDWETLRRRLGRDPNGLITSGSRNQ